MIPEDKTIGALRALFDRQRAAGPEGLTEEAAESFFFAVLRCLADGVVKRVIFPADGADDRGIYVVIDPASDLRTAFVAEQWLALFPAHILPPIFHDLPAAG